MYRVTLSLLQLGLLKAIGTLVAVTPYHRLQPGLLTRLINKTSAFLKNFQNDPVKFANLQASILAIWGSILAKKNLTPELRSLITSKLDSVIFSGYQMPLRSSCWLIDVSRFIEIYIHIGKRVEREDS